MFTASNASSRQYSHCYSRWSLCCSEIFVSRYRIVTMDDGDLVTLKTSYASSISIFPHHSAYHSSISSIESFIAILSLCSLQELSHVLWLGKETRFARKKLELLGFHEVVRYLYFWTSLEWSLCRIRELVQTSALVWSCLPFSWCLSETLFAISQFLCWNYSCLELQSSGGLPVSCH